MRTICSKTISTIGEKSICAGIGHDLADRRDERLEQRIDRLPDRRDEIIVHVDDVETDQQAHDELHDHQHDDDLDQIADNLEQGDSEQGVVLSREGCALLAEPGGWGQGW